MARCLSFTLLRDWSYARAFSAAGLRPVSSDLGGGTVLRCWAPRRPRPSTRPSVVLLHGFGAQATWQWASYIRPLLRAGLDVYVPDILFFGGSYTPLPRRTEAFQAECVLAALDRLGVDRIHGLVGVSYGGFVAYRMAAMRPAAVERVVLCCSGVAIEERDLAAGLFVVSDINEAASILLPQSPERLRQLIRLSFVRPPPPVPACFLADYINVMCTDYLKEKTELLHALIKDRKLSDLPKIAQPTLIVWGEQDQIFPLELGHRIKRHLEDNSQLVVIKNAGHAVNLEKSKEFCRHIINFLVDSSSKGLNKHKETRGKFAASIFGMSMKRLASNRPLLSGEKT